MNKKLFYTLLIIILGQNAFFAQDYPIETILQKGHSGPIYCQTFSTDGKLVATGSMDATIKIWNYAQCKEIRTLIGHTGNIRDVIFHPNGIHLFSASSDQTIIQWNIYTGEIIKKFSENQGKVVKLAINKEGTLLASTDMKGFGKIWNIEQGVVIKNFEVDPATSVGEGSPIKYASDGTIIVTGNDNGIVNIINTTDGKIISTIKTREGFCGGCPTFIDLSKNSKNILTATRNGSICIWETKTGKKIFELEHDNDKLVGVHYSSDEKNILIATEGTITVWNIASKNKITNIEFKQSTINSACFSPNSKQILTSHSDRITRIWNASNGKFEKELSGYLKEMEDEALNLNLDSRWEYYSRVYLERRTDIKISPDGKYLIKGKLDSIARIWNIETGQKKIDLKGHSKVVICYDFSPDQKYIATGSGDNTIKIWDFATGKEIKTIKAHSAFVYYLCFSNDGNQIASCGADGYLKTWDIETGTMLNRYDMIKGSPYFVKYSPKDLYLIVSGLNNTLFQLETDAFQSFRTYIGHTENVACVDFSNDGKLMLSASWDGSVKVWDFGTGALFSKFKGHKAAVYCANFLNKGDMIISGGADYIARLWETNSGREIRQFTGHKASITSLCISQDGSTLITCDIEGIIKMWDINTGKEIITHIMINPKEWMTQTTGGYFDASENARKKIYFVKGIEIFNIDQFFEDFFRPGLYENAVKSKGSINQKFDLNDKLKQSPPPDINIVAPLSNDNFDSEIITIHIEMTDNGGGINELRIFQNGKALPITETKTRKIKKGQTYEEKYDIKLIPGENIISASAFSNGRIESLPTTSVFNYLQNDNHPSCYIFAIGINTYQNSVLNLNYAKDDAQAFVKTITARSKKIFKKIEVVSLYDKDANKKNILAQLDAMIEKAKIEDVFVFYYAGHGVMLEEKFYFVPNDCVRLYDESIKTDAIFAGDIQEKFKKIKALKQLVILDACQSGGSTEILGARGSFEEKALAQLSRAAGVHVLASAGSEQYAGEFKKLGHGLFTYVLLEALAGKADGAPNDGKITIYELKSYLDDQVPVFSQEYKGQTQYPYTFSKGNDFPISFE